MSVTRQFVITAEWDDEAQVWFVADSDVPGLATEADTIDNLARKLQVMVPELLELNGVIASDSSDVPFSLTAQFAGAHGHC